MRLPLFGSRTRAVRSTALACVVAIASPTSAWASAHAPARSPTDAEAPTWDGDEPTTPAETKPAETKPSETTPAEPTPSEATPAEPKPAAPAPSEPATEPGPTGTPTSAGPTAPKETTTSGPTLGDGKTVGEPRPKTRKDEATVLEGVPDRMRPMQKAGWWTLFGGFVFATVGGVFSGLAERQEDKAQRIAVRFDENSAQPNYEDVKNDYEQIVGRGRAFANSAIALGVIGGALAVAGITLLAVDEARLRKGKRKDGKRRAKLELRKGGLQVKF
jgi:hypothetical protein